MSFFQSISPDVKKKDQDNILKSPLLYKNFSGDIKSSELFIVLNSTFETLNLPKEHFIKGVESLILNSFGQISFSILNGTKLFLTPKDSSKLEKNILRFYRFNCFDLSDYIPPNSKVITFGRGIYNITKSDDLQPYYFYDVLSNKYNFFAPELKSYVWPIDDPKKVFFYKDNWGRDLKTVNAKTSDNFQGLFAREQFKRASEYKIKSSRYKKPDLEYVKEPNEFLTKHMEEKEVAWDTETSSLHFARGEVGCITMSFDGKKGYYLPFDKINKKLLNKFFRDKYQVLANGKFDLKYLKKYGINNVKVDFDTLGAGHLLNEMRSNSLKTHAWMYTKFGGYDLPLEYYKMDHKITNYLDIPLKIMLPYATMDAIVTYRSYELMKKELIALDNNHLMNNGWSLSKYYYDIMIPGINMFTDIEMQGMHVDIKELEKRGIELEKQITEIKKEIYEKLGANENYLNIDSSSQLGNFLKNVKSWEDLDHGKDRKSHTSKDGLYLTGVDQLKRWSKLGHEEADLILKYRELSTLQKNFIGKKENNSGTWKHIVKHKDETYRIHSNFAVMLADSGRNKSSSPNFQNYPSHGDKAKFFRTIFNTPQDHVFLSVDYSGLQLRLSAIKSDDPIMRDVFVNQSGDMHSLSTVKILLNNKISFEEFLKRKEEEDPEVLNMRFKSKSINFGLIFLAMEQTLIQNIFEPEWSYEECIDFCYNNKESIIEKYNEAKDNRKLYMKEIIDHKGRKTVRISPKDDDKDYTYYTVAFFTREAFFDTYNILKEDLLNTQELASSQGYIRSIYGVFRRLPELTISGRTSDFKKMAKLRSISVNSPIQNMEGVVVMRLMIELHDWLKENNMKSYIFSQIHDAVELYVHKSEIEKVCNYIREIAERDYEEYNNIPLEVEGNVADPINNELWDMGPKWNKYLN